MVVYPKMLYVLLFFFDVVIMGVGDGWGSRFSLNDSLDFINGFGLFESVGSGFCNSGFCGGGDGGSICWRCCNEFSPIPRAAFTKYCIVSAKITPIMMRINKMKYSFILI